MKAQDKSKRKRGKVRFDREKRYTITMTQSGIYVRAFKQRKVRAITFDELIDLTEGQLHLRLA